LKALRLLEKQKKVNIAKGWQDHWFCRARIKF
jgi:hypothetical protein